MGLSRTWHTPNRDAPWPFSLRLLFERLSMLEHDEATFSDFHNGVSAGVIRALTKNTYIRESTPGRFALTPEGREELARLRVMRMTMRITA